MTYNVEASKILRPHGGFNGSCASKRFNINEFFPKLRLLLPRPPQVPFSAPLLSSAVLGFLNPKQMLPPCSSGKCCEYNRLKCLIDHKQASGDNESLVIRAPLEVTQLRGWSLAAHRLQAAPPGSGRGLGPFALPGAGMAKAEPPLVLLPFGGRSCGWDEQRPPRNPRPLYTSRQPGSRGAGWNGNRWSNGLSSGASASGTARAGGAWHPASPQPSAAGGHGGSTRPNGPCGTNPRAGLPRLLPRPPRNAPGTPTPSPRRSPSCPSRSARRVAQERGASQPPLPHPAPGDRKR